MDDSILSLYNDNLITKESALHYAHKPSELAKKLTDFYEVRGIVLEADDRTMHGQ